MFKALIGSFAATAVVAFWALLSNTAAAEDASNCPMNPVAGVSFDRAVLNLGGKSCTVFGPSALSNGRTGALTGDPNLICRLFGFQDAVLGTPSHTSVGSPVVVVLEASAEDLIKNNAFTLDGSRFADGKARIVRAEPDFSNRVGYYSKITCTLK